jgi:putative hydrolase of the HAD superfamily
MERRICVVFDIDDTLYLERDYVLSGFEAVGRWAAQWLHIEHFAESCWAKFLSGSRGAIFNEVLCEFGAEADPAVISTLIEIYRTHRPCIVLAPDVREALAAMPASVPFAIVSDGPIASQSRKVEALRLNGFAAPIILTEALGRQFRKPHPRGFELVSNYYPGMLFLYVGDNPLKDFSAPKELGWVTVRVRRVGGLHYAAENTAITPDHEISDLSTLPDMIARL